jgi:microcystin-dependent protein
MKKLIFFIFLGVITHSTVIAQSPFIGELRLFPYNFTPSGWLACEGQLLPIAQNNALYSILGANYGGNGVYTFALPDLRGNAVVGTIDRFSMGTQDGSDFYTLTLNQLPAHTHNLNVTAIPCNNTSGTVTTPGYFGVNMARGNEFNSKTNVNTALTNLVVSSAGSSVPVSNMQPFLVLRWCICIEGSYPARY